MNETTAIIIAIILIIYIISKRNEFEKLRESVKHQSSEIGNFIEKRADCLEDALSIAKTAYGHEVEGIERMTAKDQLDQLRYLGEKYPYLQSISGYTDTLNKAFDLNNDITASRSLCNGNIKEYNNAIASFPGLIVAKIFGYKREKFIDEENMAANRVLKKRHVDISKY